jgi:hypothetical protein
MPERGEGRADYAFVPFRGSSTKTGPAVCASSSGQIPAKFGWVLTFFVAWLPAGWRLVGQARANTGASSALSP